MKQHITEEQLGEINRHQAKRLKEWYWKTQPSYNGWKASFGLLSIGQMIEFLNDREVFISFDKLTVDEFILNDGPNSIRGSEPCDVLWKALKSELNK